MIFNPKIDPQTVQTAPRRIQEGLESLHILSGFLYSILVHFELRVGLLWESIWAPKSATILALGTFCDNSDTPEPPKLSRNRRLG